MQKKNKNQVKIYSIHYNKPEYIEIQKKLFDKFINFEYNFIVINNAFDSYLKDEIERQCEELEIKCIICDNQIEKMSSNSHQNSFKYIISDIKDDESFLIVDHDLFLISDLNIKYFDNCDLLYLPQTRNDIEYPWPGLIYFRNLNDKDSISFNSGIINGNPCDTGGELYYYIQNSKNINIKKIKEEYVYIDTDKVSILDSIFLHLIGGSGWNKEINLEKKIKYLKDSIR